MMTALLWRPNDDMRWTMRMGQTSFRCYTIIEVSASVGPTDCWGPFLCVRASICGSLVLSGWFMVLTTSGITSIHTFVRSFVRSFRRSADQHLCMCEQFSHTLPAKRTRYGAARVHRHHQHYRHNQPLVVLVLERGFLRHPGGEINKLAKSELFFLPRH